MRRMILGLAVAVLAAGMARADEKADAILKKAIEAHGGTDALTKYKGSRASMKGEMAVMGSDVAFTGKMSYNYPQQYSLEVNLEIMGQKILVNQVVNGEKVKATVKVGDMLIDQTKEQEPEAKFKLLLQEASAFFPLLDKKKFEVKAEPDEDVMGSKASVLIITPSISEFKRHQSTARRVSSPRAQRPRQRSSPGGLSSGLQEGE